MEMVFKNFGFFMNIHIITVLYHLYFLVTTTHPEFFVISTKLLSRKVCMAENHRVKIFMVKW